MVSVIELAEGGEDAMVDSLSTLNKNLEIVVSSVTRPRSQAEQAENERLISSRSAPEFLQLL